jgi:hypothetical protein
MNLWQAETFRIVRKQRICYGFFLPATNTDAGAPKINSGAGNSAEDGRNRPAHFLKEMQMNIKGIIAAVLGVSLSLFIAAEGMAAEKYYDRNGKYIGQKTNSGRIYDSHHQYQGKVTESGKVYDSHNTYQGQVTSSGRIYDSNHTSQGRVTESGKTYDSHNQLVQEVKPNGNVYDGKGHRIGKVKKN